jgi:molecular chaperone HscB
LNARAASQEQAWSLEQSSLLNDAYRTLRDPIKRTEYLLHLEGVVLEEQSKSATEQARATGEIKKQIVPPDLLEEVFELNMQLEELRMNKKMGEDDPALIAEIGKQKLSLEAKHEALLQELQSYWKTWDSLVDHGNASSEERAQASNKMVDVLNRRNYIRNLVRDVNAAMEE